VRPRQEPTYKRYTEGTASAPSLSSIEISHGGSASVTIVKHGSAMVKLRCTIKGE
jgi:hypothetical protein